MVVAATAAIVAVPPPSFHDGGLVDEVDIRARRGEAVVSPAAVRALGGAEGIRQVNAGRAPAGQTHTTVIKLDHRVVDVQTSRAAGRTGSPLWSALRATQPRSSGRHNPYRTET